MIDLRDVSEEDLGQTQKEIRRHVIERGWKALIPYKGSAHYFLTRPDGKELHIFSSTPSTTSYAAGHLANDKFATYGVVQQTDVPQLDTIKVNEDDSLDEALEFIKKEGTVVVKPIDGGHGNGITLNVTNETELKEAITIGLKATNNVRSVLVQKQYAHDTIYDLRILYIGYEYAAAIQRVAARVYGDGLHTIQELIEIENATDRRGRAYYAQLATINVEKATRYLKDAMKTVPADGEEVQVLGIANYGAGGETIDVTDDIPDWLIEYGRQVAVSCGLAVAGVDFMLAQFPKKEHTNDDLDVAMTEVNKAPLLTMHDTPTSGISRGVMSKYMDYLASL
jgi:cyanophycin synthetase